MDAFLPGQCFARTALIGGGEGGEDSGGWEWWSGGGDEGATGKETARGTSTRGDTDPLRRIRAGKEAETGR